MAKKRRSKMNKKTLLYHHCQSLQQLGVISEAAKKNGSKGFLPAGKNGDLNEQEMGRILLDVEDYSSQVKALERKISRLEQTIKWMQAEKSRRRQACRPHHVISIEVEATAGVFRVQPPK